MLWTKLLDIYFHKNKRHFFYPHNYQLYKIVNHIINKPYFIFHIITNLAHVTLSLLLKTEKIQHLDIKSISKIRFWNYYLTIKALHIKKVLSDYFISIHSICARNIIILRFKCLWIILHINIDSK